MAFNLAQIFKALADAEARYVVVGGMAVILHGHLRATRDLDLVIGLEPANCTLALHALSNIGLRPRLPVTLADFADPLIRERWANEKHMQVLQLWDPANPVRSVDVFVREPLDFDSMWADAVVKDLDGVPIPVVSVAHLVALKQQADRPQDREDIQALRALGAMSRADNA